MLDRGGESPELRLEEAEEGNSGEEREEEGKVENKKEGRGNGEERGLDGLFLAGTKATVLVNFR